MTDRREVPPDDLPRSPTGRVPAWVAEELAGREPEREGRRSDTGPITADVTRLEPRRRRRRWRASRPRWGMVLGWGFVVLVVGFLVVATLQGRTGPWSARSPVPGADGDRPPAGFEEGARPRGSLGAPLPQPASGAFTYIGTQDDGTTPITWSPCRPIHYVVRTDHVTADGLGVLRSAIDEISRDSGLRFVYDGTTTEDPRPDRAAYQPDRYGEQWAPVLISWVTPAEDPDVDSSVLGLTRPRPVLAPDGALVYVTGQVEMSASLIANVQKRYGVIATRTVFLHELGHLIGLDHTASPTQLMYPSYEVATKSFRADEVEGVRSLGSGPCRGDV